MVKERTNDELKAEQVEQKRQENSIFSLPSTYSLVTAENLLAGFGVKLSQKSISKQIQNSDTFYHALMYLPAKRLNISVNIERCRDIQAFGQQKLIHYLFSGEASKSEAEQGHNARDVVEQHRQHMVELGKEFVGWENGCIERGQKLTNDLQEKVLAWHRTVSDVVNDLINCLYDNSLEVEQNFTDKVFINMLEYSAGIKLTPQQINNYSCSEMVGITERTVIYLISSSELSNKLTAGSLKNMRPKFKSFDDRLKEDFDSLSGINKDGKMEIESDLKFIDDLAVRLEEHVVKLSKKLFDYYTEYSSDNSLKVGAGDALELGVDQSVADDYKALQM